MKKRMPFKKGIFFESCLFLGQRRHSEVFDPNHFGLSSQGIEGSPPVVGKYFNGVNITKSGRCFMEFLFQESGNACSPNLL